MGRSKDPAKRRANKEKRRAAKQAEQIQQKPQKQAPVTWMFDSFMYRTGFDRLIMTPLEGINRPSYDEKHDLKWYVFVLRFVGFRNDLNHMNPGIVLSRPVTEAAWLRAVLEPYRVSKQQRFSSDVEAKKHRDYHWNLMSNAMSQRHGFFTDAYGGRSTPEYIQQYWESREALSPGLDIAELADDTDADHHWELTPSGKKVIETGDVISDCDSEARAANWEAYERRMALNGYADGGDAGGCADGEEADEEGLDDDEEGWYEDDEDEDMELREASNVGWDKEQQLAKEFHEMEICEK